MRGLKNRMTLSEDGRYVYCIIEGGAGKSFGSIGISEQSREVYTISFRDISAVVSDTPLIEYEPSEKNAMAHENVVELVMFNHTVLPMRFCTIIKGDDGVRKMLESFYDEFKKNLVALKGKIEVGLKVYWDSAETEKKVAETSGNIKTMREEIAKKPQGAAYLLKLKLDAAIKGEALKQREQYAEEIRRKLQNLAHESRSSTLIGEDMILNAAFLIDRETFKTFKEETERILGGYRNDGLEFNFTGPWPPYSFVKIRKEVKG